MVETLNAIPQFINNSPLITRIFNKKKRCLIDYIKKKCILGNIKYILWIVDYQQRGYRYYHNLLCCDFDTNDVY